MTLRNVFAFGLLALAMFLYIGCQPTGGGGGGDGAPAEENPDTGGDPENGDADTDGGDTEPGEDGGGTTPGEGGADVDEGTDQPADENDNSDADPGDDGGDNDNDNSDAEDIVLTDDQQESVETTVATVQDLASVMAVLLYAAAGEGVDDGIGGSDCPVFSLDNGQLVLDYGEGCTPALYPESTFSGSVSGELNVSERTATLTFDDFAIDGDSVDGTVTLSYTRDNGISTIEAEVDLAFDDGRSEVTTTGELTVVIDESTGEITITYGDLVIADQSGSDAVILENVHSDVASNGNFLPDAGTATITWEEPPPPVTMVITFTDQTPVTGTVLISVNDSPTISYTVGDLIEELEEL